MQPTSTETNPNKITVLLGDRLVTNEGIVSVYAIGQLHDTGKVWVLCKMLSNGQSVNSDSPGLFAITGQVREWAEKRFSMVLASVIATEIGYYKDFRLIPMDTLMYSDFYLPPNSLQCGVFKDMDPDLQQKYVKRVRQHITDIPIGRILTTDDPNEVERCLKDINEVRIWRKLMRAHKEQVKGKSSFESVFSNTIKISKIWLKKRQQSKSS